MSLSQFLFEAYPLQKRIGRPIKSSKTGNFRRVEITPEIQAKQDEINKKMERKFNNFIFFPLTSFDLDTIKKNELDIERYHNFFATMLGNNLQQSYRYSGEFCVIEMEPGIMNAVRALNPDARSWTNLKGDAPKPTDRRQAEIYAGVVTKLHRHIRKIWLTPNASDEVKHLFQLYSGKYNVKVFLMSKDFGKLSAQDERDLKARDNGGYKRFGNEHLSRSERKEYDRPFMKHYFDPITKKIEQSLFDPVTQSFIKPGEEKRSESRSDQLIRMARARLGKSGSGSGFRR